jgi:hypothetical protein
MTARRSVQKGGGCLVPLDAGNVIMERASLSSG